MKSVTINKWAYVKNMKRYSYTVKEHPNYFFFFEEELKKSLMTKSLKPTQSEWDFFFAFIFF